jgi:CRISPR-associated protein Cas1
MAATETVAQDLQFCKSDKNNIALQCEPVPSVGLVNLRPRRGVVVLCGYGISVRVERGHLVIEDGVGSDRYKGRYARIGHGLERLVVLGSDGVVSLSALRWLADQNVSFIMLERDGTVLATTGPVRPSDIRVRRAQALAHQTGVAFRISRELIDRKLAGQERVVRESLQDHTSSTLITQIRSELAEVESIEMIRSVEARAARLYWKAWRAVSIAFPDKDLPLVPEHWRSFHARISPLTGSPRLAANPVNAILNYLYALLEAECRLAVSAMGLDPEMGVLHADAINRDSLACDLMEPIRPDVDAYVLNRIVRRPLKRNWFFEERNGNCRLMADLASQLAQTAAIWARLVAPLAEWTAKEIASTTRTRRPPPATRLTQNRKRSLTGGTFIPSPKNSVRLQNICSVCGNEIRNGIEQCWFCAMEASTQRLKRVASDGRIVSHNATAEAKRSKTRLANHAILQEWSASDQPSWLTTKFYEKKMQPLVADLSSSAIVRHLKVSRGYAAEIRRGRVPHPRHWRILVRLLGLSR